MLKLPRNDSGGLAKLAALFATGLLVSIGLCGANAWATGIANGRVIGEQLLMVTGVLELICILVCLIGLLVVGPIAVARFLWDSFASRKSSLSITPRDDKKD